MHEGSGNLFLGNTRNHLWIIGNTLSRSVVLASMGLDAFYQDTGEAIVAAGSSLRMRPGLVWKLGASLFFTVNGALSVEGTPGEKVIFTSYRDDSVGGNANGGSSSESGQPGDWRTLRFNDSVLDSLTRVEHAEIRYGGRFSTEMVYLDRANVTFDSVRISDHLPLVADFELREK